MTIALSVSGRLTVARAEIGTLTIAALTIARRIGGATVRPLSVPGRLTVARAEIGALTVAGRIRRTLAIALLAFARGALVVARSAFVAELGGGIALRCGFARLRRRCLCRLRRRLWSRSLRRGCRFGYRLRRLGDGLRTGSCLRGGSLSRCTGGRGLGFGITALLLGERGLNSALTGILLFLTQAAGAGRPLWLRGLRTWRTGRRIWPRRQICIVRRPGGCARGAGRRCADAAFGFDHHRFRPAVAEALLHRTRRNIAAHARLQRKGGAALTVLIVVGLVVFSVAHAACFT